MNRETYLKDLSKYLSKLPKADYEDAMGYFEECFDEVGVDGESTLIEELGTPRDVATEMLSNLASEKLELDKKELSKGGENNIAKGLLITVLLIFAAPIGIPLTIALIAVIFALLVCLGAFIFSAGMIALSMFLVGIKLLIIGISTFTLSFSGALVIVGSGFVSLALAIFTLVLTILFCKFLRFCLKKIVEFISSKRRAK